MKRMWVRAALSLTAAGWGANQFSSLLGAYESNLGLSGSTVTSLFAVYVVGLVPGLLLGGPVADRHGRRPVVLGAVVAGVAGSASLMAGVSATGWLMVGRLFVGVGTGAALAAGSAWVKELSHPPYGDSVGPGPAARRAGLFLSGGFSASGLLSAAVAQWVPQPMLAAYVPHLFVSAIALALAWNVPETCPPRRMPAQRQGSLVRDPRFLRKVVPVAPWVFIAPSIGFGVLPGLVDGGLGEYAVIYAGVATAVTPGSGLLIQPLGRRLAARRPIVPAVTGLGVIALGLALAATAIGRPLLALVADVLLGSGYGLCVTYGLSEVGRIAPAFQLARLTAVFWALAYLGFCAPYVFTLLDDVAQPGVLLSATAALAVLTCIVVVLLWQRPSACDEADGNYQERSRADQVQ